MYDLFDKLDRMPPRTTNVDLLAAHERALELAVGIPASVLPNDVEIVWSSRDKAMVKIATPRSPLDPDGYFHIVIDKDGWHCVVTPSPVYAKYDPSFTEGGKFDTWHFPYKKFNSTVARVRNTEKVTFEEWAKAKGKAMST